MRFTSQFLSTALCALTFSQLSSQAPLEKRQSKDDPCTKLASYWARGVTRVPAEIGYDCLRSVPFNSTQALFITQQARTFARVLSYQAFYNKPENISLNIERVDLNGTLNDIEARARRRDGFESDYSFNRALTELFGRYHDGHTVFAPTCPFELGTFSHDYPLVAVLPPNEKIPKVYIASKETGAVGAEVVEIDGEPALKHLLELVRTLNGPTDSQWIDADTRWNRLFLRRDVHGIDAGNFAHRDFYPGDSFKIKLASGQEITVEWYLTTPYGPQVVKNAAPKVNSTEAFRKICLAPPPNNGTTSGIKASLTDLSGAIGLGKRSQLEARKQTLFDGFLLNDRPPVVYPEVLLRTKGSEQTLHIIKDSKIAVWGFHSFGPRSSVESADKVLPQFFKYWRNHMDEVFELLRARDIKKVILDLSSNDGGMITLGFETVRRFFPESKPFYAMDMRRTPAVDIYNNETGYWQLLDDIQGRNITSLNDFLGPVKKYDDFFTKPARFNSTETVFGQVPGIQFNTTGKPLFDPADLLVVTDGACGSACAMVAEAFRRIGVASVAVGGQPVDDKTNKTMQAVGGVKGMQVVTWESWSVIGGNTSLPTNMTQHFPKPVPVRVIGKMNLRNSYEEEDLTVPLEFKYQPAEGHMFYTKEMITDRTKLWVSASNLAWDKNGKNLLQGKVQKKSDGKQPDVLKFNKKKRSDKEELIAGIQWLEKGWLAALKSRVRR